MLRSRSIEILGYTNNALPREQRAEALRCVVAAAGRGELAVDHQELPLAQAEEGWRRTADGHGGRVVLVC